jgi:hypothetical protein
MEPDNKTLGHNPTGEASNPMVETYAEDMAKAIGSDVKGNIKDIIHGEEAHEIEKKNLSPESKQNQIFMYVGVALLALGFSVLGFFTFTEQANTVPVTPQFVPLIYNDQASSLEIAGIKTEAIIGAVLSKINSTGIKNGGVEGIYLTENKTIIGMRRFMTLIKSSFVSGDNPIFIHDEFLMGVVKNEANPEAPDGSGFFILLKMRGTADIFDAMRNWENKMFSDLHDFLGVTVGSDNNYLLTKNFEDGIVENKNARILSDTDGKIILMYVYADDNSVVITDSRGAVHEIVLLLASSKTKQ